MMSTAHTSNAPAGLRRPASALAALVAMTLAFTLGASPATASAASEDDPALTASRDAVLNLQDTMERVADWPSIASTRLDSLVDKVVSGDFVDSGRALDGAHARGLRSDSGTEIVRIPFVASQNPIGQSGLTVFFDRNGDVLSRIELVFEPLSSTSGRVQMWNDGALAMDQVVSAARSDVAQSGLAIQSRAAYRKGDWWGNLNTCLSAAGIPAWALAGLSIVCGVACAVTAGIGCGVCLAAAIGGWSGSVTACVAVANKYS